MTDLQRIIHTEIIDTETDIFWHNDATSYENISPKNVLILTQKFDEQSTEHLQLSKILDACKLNSDTYNLLQFAEHEKKAWHQLKTAAQPAMVILFGIHPADLGISALFRLNRPNSFDGITWIPALSLQELEQQPQAKKDLWGNALKPLFADIQ
ncbi:MAG TPA: hypothetical protein VEB40_02595 [Flavipsychrobacter sp.]|nr:hypothetical protein [Flavipsychrobacter sp.]